jgi:hypothetical protein
MTRQSGACQQAIVSYKISEFYQTKVSVDTFV